jgi:hypothetical protein
MRRALAALLLGLALAALPAEACDLCSPPPPEFRSIQEEIRAAPTVVLADRAGEDMRGRTQLVVRQVLHGGENVVPGQSVSVDEALALDGVYLLFGSRTSFDARRPRRVEEDVAEFATIVARKPTLVESKPDAWGRWLALMVPHLSSEDALVAASAGKEFADAPYAAVAAVKGRADPEDLLAALENVDTPKRSRGALALLVGLCGTDEHAERLEALFGDERYRAALGHDAIVAGYLMLRGTDGLERVRRLVTERLAERDARTGVNVLAALRFHAQNTDRLPRAALVGELHALLAEDALAPAVILELATLEHWESLPQVMETFRRLKPKGPMILGPAARFVQECPLPEAEAAREEVMGRRRDPEDSPR